MITKSFIDKNCIYPDFPKPGIKFVDIFPCLEKEPLWDQLKDIKFRGIVLMPEARGFLFYSLINRIPHTAIVPLRKEGKMPGSLIMIPIIKEYGEDNLYLQVDCLVRAVDRLKPYFGTTIPVMIWDDLLATGGSAIGIALKVRELSVTASDGTQVVLKLDSAAFYMELEGLNGRKNLILNGLGVQSVIKYKV